MYTVGYKRSAWFYCVKNVYGQQCLNEALLEHPSPLYIWP